MVGDCEMDCLWIGRGRRVRYHFRKCQQPKNDSTDPVVLRLLGKSEDTGKLLGLDREWLARAVQAVGNYGEIFDKHLGEKTRLASNVD